MARPSISFRAESSWDQKPLPLPLPLPVVGARIAGVFAVLALTHILNALRLFMSGEQAWRWRGKVFRMWAKLTAWILGMRVKVRGPVPEGPYLVASNHLSYVDIIAIASQLDAVFVAKKEVLNWPFLGPVVKGFDTLFVDRGDPRDLIRVNQGISRVLRSGRGVVFFPEGTSTSGAEILPFQPPLFQAAAARQFPVHYLTIFYKTPGRAAPASGAVCWWGDREFLPHLRELLRLRRFKARLVFGDRPVVSSKRKELSQRVWAAACEQFVPVR